MNYKEQLEHPLWQKRRLSILQRDNYSCRYCGSSDIQLHVHHRYYVSGRKVWEYPDVALLTLCKSCHKNCGSRYDDGSWAATEWEAILAAFVGNDDFGSGLPVVGDISELRRVMDISHRDICRILCAVLNDDDYILKKLEEFKSLDLQHQINCQTELSEKAS